MSLITTFQRSHSPGQVSKENTDFVSRVLKKGLGLPTRLIGFHSVAQRALGPLARLPGDSTDFLACRALNAMLYNSVQPNLRNVINFVETNQRRPVHSVEYTLQTLNKYCHEEGM